jgi:hypothetical protein
VSFLLKKIRRVILIGPSSIFKKLWVVINGNITLPPHSSKLRPVMDPFVIYIDAS